MGSFSVRVDYMVCEVVDGFVNIVRCGQLFGNRDFIGNGFFEFHPACVGDAGGF